MELGKIGESVERVIHADEMSKCSRDLAFCLSRLHLDDACLEASLIHEMAIYSSRHN
jgi:hypothetical protein